MERKFAVRYCLPEQKAAITLTRKRGREIKNERNMTNNILEQFEELFSRCSIGEKMGKEIQQERMWQQLSESY